MSALVGCADLFELVDDGENKHNIALKGKALSALKSKNLDPAAPILIRIFKQERLLEVWKQAGSDNKMVHLTSYRICAFSGTLGPKKREGDKQAPEGFYHVGKAQMNPYSSFHLSFNLGYPNLYERTNKQTGSLLMVHGDCRSVGCYAMNDRQIEEIYALVREAHSGGQKQVQVQAFPFRMTDRNMKQHTKSDHYAFWQNLKEGYDAFERTRKPVKVNVCDKRYMFNKQTVNGADTFRASHACPQVRSLDGEGDVATLKNATHNDATHNGEKTGEEDKNPVEAVYTTEKGRAIEVIPF